MKETDNNEGCCGCLAVFVVIGTIYSLIEVSQYTLAALVIGICILVALYLKGAKTSDESNAHEEEPKTVEEPEKQWTPQLQVTTNQDNIPSDDSWLNYYDEQEDNNWLNYYDGQEDNSWLNYYDEQDDLQQLTETQNTQEDLQELTQKQNKQKEILAKQLLDKQLSSMVDTMSGEAYENYVGYKLLEQGWLDVDYTSKTNDYGADIIAQNPEGELVCIQCKRYADSVGIAAIQEVSAAKLYYNCKYAIAITNSTFTPNAKELAKRTNVELWENFR